MGGRSRHFERRSENSSRHGERLWHEIETGLITSTWEPTWLRQPNWGSLNSKMRQLAELEAERDMRQQQEAERRYSRHPSVLGRGAGRPRFIPGGAGNTPMLGE